MTNDLEQRVHEVLEETLDYIRMNANTDVHVGDEICIVEKLIKDQQAEINRLKSGQLKLKPMSELKALIEQGNTSYHDGSIIYVVHKVREDCYKSGNRAIVHIEDGGIVDDDWFEFDDFVGWHDLPTEIEVTA